MTPVPASAPERSSRWLVDVPRCVALDAVQVAAPSLTAVSRSGWRAAFGGEGANARGAGTLLFRQRVVEECLDTIAVLRSYREPQVEETWRTPAASERRLLAQANVILGMGPAALTQILGLALDPDVPDPGRVFAALFVVGCAEDPAWTAPLLRCFSEAVQRHPGEAAAAVEALCLSPHPSLDAALTPLLPSGDARLRVAVVRVLGYRGALSQEAWTSAMQAGDPAMVAAALAAPMAAYDRALCDRLLQDAARQDDETIASGAVRAGVALDLSSMHGHAARIAANDPLRSDALHAMALFGRLDDAVPLRDLLQGPGRWAAVRAAGVLGAASLVPDLLALWQAVSGPSDEAAALGHALHGITGIAAPDAETFSRHWHTTGDSWRDDVRYRQGRPVTAAHLLSLLDGAEWRREQRAELWIEVQAAAGTPLPHFSPCDFVGIQEASLRRIAAALPGWAH